MEMVKKVKGDRVIKRRKLDYDNNIKIWGIRGWELDDGKPKAQPKNRAKARTKVDSRKKKNLKLKKQQRKLNNGYKRI